MLKLTQQGALIIKYNDKEILSEQLVKDYTKIQPGYVSCGLIRDRILPKGQANVFDGKIYNLRVSVNTLERAPILR